MVQRRGPPPPYLRVCLLAAFVLLGGRPSSSLPAPAAASASAAAGCESAAAPAPDAPLPRAAFVTFGSARYAAALRRIAGEAAATGAFASVRAFMPEDIAPAYAAAHADVLSAPRGAGFWLWKPYFVLRVLGELAEGELLMWADAGCEFRASPAPYLALAHRHGFLGFRMEPEHTVQRWTKGDIFEAVGLELGLFGIEPQLAACVFVLRKSARTEAFVREWLRLAENLQLVGDAPSLAPNHPTFHENRHDQAIFSLLVYKMGLQLVLADQTWPPEAARIISATRRRDS